MTAPPEILTSRRRLLLERAIDYAGLFPPAGLDMVSAVTSYLAYRASPDAWALGRFVVPVTRLSELEAALCGTGFVGSPVALSALLGPTIAADLACLDEFNRRSTTHGASVEVVECRASSVAEVRQALEVLPASGARYVELPFGPAIGELLDLIAAAGAFAKLRTGGVTPESIPEPSALAAALAALSARRLAFKATAGLHHPVTGEYPLTYAPGSARARMYGYVNLMAAAGLAFAGAPQPVVERALLFLHESDLASLDGVRPGMLHGFGSCSFREPLDEFSAAAHRIVA